jgi:hypothetical protein
MGGEISGVETDSDTVGTADLKVSTWSAIQSIYVLAHIAYPKAMSGDH